MKKYIVPEVEMMVMALEDVITASPVDVDTPWNEDWNEATIKS